MNSIDPMRLNLDIIKSAKLQKCDCGGVIFTEKIMFKKISALVSPTGKEELYPLQVMICDKCGKIPRELNVYDMVPEEYLATKKLV
jgi:hypothetical protein